MTVAYLGSETIGGMVPGGLAAAAAGEAGIAGALPDIQARLAALAAFAPSPVDFAASIATAQQVIAGIELAIAAGVTPPSLDAQIAIVAGILADLQATALQVQANLTIVLDFIGFCAAAGVHGYTYSGQVGNLGSELGTELASGLPGGSGAAESCNALVLVTTSGATWATMGNVFKVAP